jgi:hypothetical protein
MIGTVLGMLRREVVTANASAPTEAMRRNVTAS